MIDSKEKFYKLFHQGLFGNKPIVFDCEEYLKSDYEGLVTIRFTIPGLESYYHLFREEALAKLEVLFSQGFKKSQIKLNESPKNDTQLIQGEYNYGLENRYIEYLTYSFDKVPHKSAMRGSNIHVKYGPGCRLLLKSYLDYKSNLNLITLSECYPNHTIEFSTWTHPIGELQLNTVIWEVRYY